MSAYVVQSAGGIVYYIAPDGEPRYLIIKRYALSKKIEWVAPKGKIEKWESVPNAALREISEEAGIPVNAMRLGEEVWVTQLRSDETHKGQLNKDTTYFLVEYTGDPELVDIEDGGWFTGVYKWADLTQVMNLMYYPDMRELFRKSYHMIKNKSHNSKIKNDFISRL
jgi:8-oxo-dGTP pyrophosphatase MutT (NUDIX family)